MTAEALIEAVLADALQRADNAVAPSRLIAAMRHAVFPGGARVRPRLVLAVAQACGVPHPAAAMAGAASVELLHCASLVHDDLPCFDDADTRRGRASVHAAFGEQTAVLAGDALIVQAFEVLTADERLPAKLSVRLCRIMARAGGSPFGIAAGQAWETEPAIDLEAYHRAKTGALFIAAAEAGATVADACAAEWVAFGDAIGLAYQAADDVRDAVARACDIGKPVRQDSGHGRPSLVAERGLAGALSRLETLASRAKDSVPACPGRNALRGLVDLEMARLIPQELVERAA